MIWANGLPYLDNKGDHVFNIPVSHAMTNKPIMLPVTDFPVAEAQKLLEENQIQGFPIVENLTNKTLVGFIGRTELQYAINRANREGLLVPDAKCRFTPNPSTFNSMNSLATASHTSSPAFKTSIPLQSSRAEEENEDNMAQAFDERPSSSVIRSIDFSHYVDLAPLTVHPRLPLETVMEIFKKMGPRVILVERHGKLTGLVTVKDCLKYQFKVEKQEHASAAAAAASGFGTTGRANGGLGDGMLEQKVWEFVNWVSKKVAFWRKDESSIPYMEVDNRRDAAAAGQRRRRGPPFETMDPAEEFDGILELEDRNGANTRNR